MKIMKALNCKTMLLALALASGMTLGAQTLREEDQKEFNASGSTELSVTNQFGNINIAEWDQNKVSITYIVEVTNSDEAKARKVMDRIKVEFKEEGNLIKVKTIIGEQGNLNLHGGKDKKQSFRIDYFIKCPTNIKVSLDNQFGDMIIGSFTGTFEANQQFGSLNAVNLTGSDSKINMQFGEITIGTLINAKIDIQHCEALKISDGGVLKLHAQFTEINLGTINTLEAELNHCEFKAENLKGILKMNNNMGSTEVVNVDPGFKAIEIDQNMGDVSLGFDPIAGYQLDAEVNMGSLKVPETIKANKNKEDNVPGLKADKVRGTIGNGSSQVKISANMGSVKIR
jgi:hypothetical protein